jgi:hypothetical protein
VQRNFFAWISIGGSLELKKVLFALNEFFGHLCSYFRIKTWPMQKTFSFKLLPSEASNDTILKIYCASRRSKTNIR